MLEVQRIKESEGGIIVVGELETGGGYELRRLDYGGETNIVFLGTELIYNADGNLIMSVTRVVDYVLGHRSLFVESFPSSYNEMIISLAEIGKEIVVEVDLVANKVTIFELTSRDDPNVPTPDPLNYESKELDAFYLADYDGKSYPISVGNPEEESEIISIKLGVLVEEGMLVVGVGNAHQAVIKDQPLSINLKPLRKKEITDLVMEKLLRGE